ncbi:hypothetical protein COW64_18560 [bacterium (Candidatus Blackallbacteria) CG18_big_fil_WC_8_21_14_2_50_49_26]|nr:MAG: hypothetical protein COW64_18560 [bacterium (Candidatus Blackallbacteria) CG18_big_fil_WC_8_21_14_2_50_49_26]
MRSTYRLKGIFLLLLAGLMGCAEKDALPNASGNVMAKLNMDILSALIMSDKAAIQLWQKQGHSLNDPLAIKEHTPLTAIIQNYPIVQFLLEQGANPNLLNAQGESPLGISVKSNFNVTQLLLEKGANPNLPQKDGRSPLQLALHSGHFTIIQLLLEKGATPSISLDDNPKLCSQPGLLKLLLAKGMNIHSQDRDGSTLLHLCEQRDILQILVDKGLPLNLLNKRGESVLFSQNLEKIRYFLNIDPKIPFQNKLGSTPLHIAAENGRLDLLKFWIEEQKKSTEVSDNSGQTPLHVAVKAKHLHIVKFLLSAGAKVNAITRAQASPLFLSIYAQDIQIATELLKNQADASFHDAYGVSCLELAESNKLTALVPLLRQYGASN